MIGKSCGLIGRENAGMSSERQARNLPAESLRFPEQGLSAQGKPGPKPRQRMRRRWTTGGNSSATLSRLSEGVTQEGKPSARLVERVQAQRQARQAKPSGHG